MDVHVTGANMCGETAFDLVLQSARKLLSPGKQVARSNIFHVRKGAKFGVQKVNGGQCYEMESGINTKSVLCLEVERLSKLTKNLFVFFFSQKKVIKSCQL